MTTSDPTYYALKAIERLARVLDGRQPDTGVDLEGLDTRYRGSEDDEQTPSAFDQPLPRVTHSSVASCANAQPLPRLRRGRKPDSFPR